MSLREKSIQMAKESEIRAESLRKRREEEELKQLREAFFNTFAEYPDSVWKAYSNFFATKEGLTFKIIPATMDISDGISYFYITNPNDTSDHQSVKLHNLIDLGRYLDSQESRLRNRLRGGGDKIPSDVGEQVEQVEQVEPVEQAMRVEPKPRCKPKRMLRLNENIEEKAV